MTETARRAYDRDYKARLYADSATRGTLKARVLTWQRKEENAAKRREYMKNYNAWRKSQPELVAQDRIRSREKQRRLRAERNLDPAKRAEHLEKRQDSRAGAIKERVVERYLVERVSELGGFCPKFTDLGRRGAPDRLVMLPGAPTLFVELKRPKGGVVSPAQQRYHELIRRAGQLVFVLKSKPEVDEFMIQVARLRLRDILT